MNPRPPNVVIIVMDCVRASDFPGGADPVGGTPFLDSLRKECIVFPRSVSSASWTVPTHASILTGLYPCDHGAFSMGYGFLPDSVRTLPERLREVGYATALISANHNLRPSLGLTRGFDRAWWGPWGVTSLRLGPRDERPFRNDESGRLDLLRKHTFEEEPRGVWKTWARLSAELPRYPWVLEGVSRIIQGVRGSASGYVGRVAPWIEPTFSSWVRQIPASQPCFTLINLMDAHEPYLPSSGNPERLGDWWLKAKTRQDVANWADGRWTPTKDEFRAIHALYREKVRGLDSRVANLVGTLLDYGRWEDTLFILTSDHGQAFGEGGFLFHGNSVEEALIRVPLWARFPKGRAGGAVASGWADSVDIVPTVLGETFPGGEGAFPGIPLEYLADRARPGPAYAMTTSRDLSSVSGVPGVGSGPEFLIAGYLKDYKLNLALKKQTVETFRFNEKGLIPLSDEDSTGSELITLREGVDTIARTFLAPHCAIRPTEHAPQIDHVGIRLRSWGYV
jgi:arylsulfatase A-like enzyme